MVEAHAHVTSLKVRLAHCALRTSIYTQSRDFENPPLCYNTSTDPLFSGFHDIYRKKGHEHRDNLHVTTLPIHDCAHSQFPTGIIDID